MRFSSGAIPALAMTFGRRAAGFLPVWYCRQQIAAQGTRVWPSTGTARVTRAYSSATTPRMGIFEDISSQMKDSMKSGDKDKLNGLRQIRAAFLTETKTAGTGNSLPDDKCIPILRKLSKVQQESIDMYRTGNKQELMEKELQIQRLIDAFLPQLADETTTQGWVDDAVQATGAQGPSDMGKVMGMLMKEHKTEMDGKLAQRLVTAKLKGA